jgi:phosphohistidine phosphatase
MELFIMRHGPAEDASPTGLDSDRALTPSGRERVRSVARELIRLGERPTMIVTSPLTRALETADIVRGEMDLGPFEEHGWLGMTGRARELVDRLVAGNQDGRMLVGHEPELSELVRSLTGRSVRMEKAMVVGVTFARAAASLRFVLEPQTLAVSRA